MIETWKQLIVFHIVISDNLGRKIIYASTLRQKFSSKIIRSISILLAISSVGLIFANKDTD